MEITNVLQGWESYKEVFTAEITLSRNEISLIKKMLEDTAEQTEETKTLLSDFIKLDDVLLKEEKNLSK